MMRDLSGRRFGRLTAVCPVGRSDPRKGPVWACRCDCGDVCEVPASLLLEGETRSCGCLKAEQDKLNLKPGYIIEHKEQVVTARILSERLQRNNTSGVKGVSWHRKTGKWMARIQYRRKSILLGYYDKLEDAAAARRRAEKEYFGK